ncbi:MAG: manganese efflux pump, partial [Clostridium celatum]|nr:manganese efflux pump [Clostridium celatum]
ELSNKELTTLAIATSIDALAIGVSFAFLNINIVSSSLIIGLITFIVCFIGVIAGKKIGGVFKDYAELIGGIILILIGINIFNEHTGFIINLIHSIF